MLIALLAMLGVDLIVRSWSGARRRSCSATSSSSSKVWMSNGRQALTRSIGSAITPSSRDSGPITQPRKLPLATTIASFSSARAERPGRRWLALSPRRCP